MANLDPIRDPAGQGISYPCRWEYMLFGVSRERMTAAVETIIVDTDYALSLSNVSRNGKYRSLRLEVVVDDEAARDRLHQALRDHADIIMVL